MATTSKKKGRRIKAADQRRLDASIPHDAHRGLRMLRSDCSEGLLKTNIACPIDPSAGEFFCAQLSDIRLDAEKLVDLVKPIIEKLVNDDKTGMFDEIAGPLEEIEKRLPGISDIAGQKVTILDIAELFVGRRSGAATVRTVLGIYRSITSLAATFNSLDKDGVSIVSVCLPVCPICLLFFFHTHPVFILSLFWYASWETCPSPRFFLPTIADSNSKQG